MEFTLTHHVLAWLVVASWILYYFGFRHRLEKILETVPAYDKRHKDPKKNYGIHGVELKFILKGRKGAVQFVISTGWHLPHVLKESSRGGLNTYVMPFDLGYHSYKPLYDGQFKTEKCSYLNNKPCYYDGSVLNAEEPYKILASQGINALWKYLEKYYNSVFENKKVEVGDE